MMENNKKNNSIRRKNIAIAVIVAVMILLTVIVGIIMYLYDIYRDMYVHVDIVDRSDSYVMPEYPVLDSSGPATGDPDNTDIDNTGTLGTEDPSVTTDNVTTDPPVTVPPIIYNPNNSFGNSPNAIPVYGNTPIYRVEQKDPNIVNILLVGTDSRDVTVERGRSDTMIVVSYNKKTGDMKMVSFLRDSLVPIEGWNWHKLNSTYSFDGIGLTVNTINQLFNLDIQRFIIIDMNGTASFMNHIGGIEVALTEAECNYYNNLYGTNFKAGICKLDGDMALKHMRNRKLDSDFGRTRRQRDVITAVVKEVLNTKSFTEISEIMNYVTTITRTNMEALEMTDLLTKVVSQKDILNISTQNVPYNDAVENAWYQGMQVLSFDIKDAAKRVNSFLYK